ncbi:DUF4097 family beta strand repeat-containing protein [Antribacter gilvus]|uniref:DUF4097 family beta strand repeat-containing protein n=1 Tax=Antribacter gilvus TaxID=2304675 RepID=UPI000F7BAA59|nr:DUF4097 family beta strand repeat-containing protein [Antribacter gilvus]
MPNETWTVDGPQTIELEGVTDLAAHVVSGRLDVVAHDEPVVRIEVHSLDGRPLNFRREGGKLSFGHETLTGWQSFLAKFRDFAGRASADVHVAVPRGTVVRIGTISGEGLLAGTTAGGKASTVSGSLIVTRTSGPLKVSTVSGDITVRDHDGNLTIGTVSGEVAFSGSAEEVSSTSVSGGITLDLTTQPRRIKASTVSGELMVRVPDAGAVDVNVSGIGGRVTVGGYQVSGGGTVRSTRPAQTQLKVSSVSGDVTVLDGDHVAPDVAPDVAV